MAKANDLRKAVKFQLDAYLRKCGNLGATAEGFRALGAKQERKLIKAHGPDLIRNVYTSVWEAKPRDKGPGLLRIPGSKKNIPEHLTRGEDELGDFYKVHSFFATVEDLFRDAAVKLTNLQNVQAAYEELLAMANLAIDLSKGKGAVFLTKICKVTNGDADKED